MNENKDKIILGDTLEVLKTLPDECVDSVITSPPYWGLRDYGVEGQLGLEKTPEEYIGKMVEIFREVKRVLKKEGTLWLNLGDSYAGSGRGGDKPGHEGKQSTNKGATAMGDYSNKAAFGNKWVAPPLGLKQKDLVGIPWRVAFALQADGWYLRQDIIWAKPNPMPESVTDRCTKSHEYIFLMAKNPKYYFDKEGMKEPSVTGDTKVRGSEGVLGSLNSARREKQKGKSWHDYKNDLTMGQSQKKDLPNLGLLFRNRRSVWTITTKPFKDAHFATFPEDLIVPMVLAGCPRGGVVLDPFIGSGTTGLVAKKLGRHYLGIDLNPAYVAMAEKRIGKILL